MDERSLAMTVSTLLAGAALLLGALGAEAAPEHRWTFEADTGGWTALNCAAGRTERAARAGEWSLAVSRGYPGCATVQRSVPVDLHDRPRVVYHVLAPRAAGPSLKTLFFLKNKDGLWYQCERHVPLYPGGWSRVEFDLSPRSPDVVPVGHFRRWGSRAAAEMEVMGVKLFSDRSFEGEVLIDEISFERAPAEPERLAIVNFRPGAPEVPRFGLFELTFELNRSYPNPFDPDLIAVDASFTDPDGRTFEVPGFYYQDFARVDRAVKRRMRSKRGPKTWRRLEDFVPVGGGCWKVRFAPMQPGEHTYTLTVVDRTGPEPRKLTTQRRTFRCTASGRKGYVRVAADRRHFEFSSGEAFYPIGHNVHASNDVSDRNCDLLDIPSDEPPDDHGLKAYESIFRKMSEHGENLAEVWMASWSLDIEWTRRWKHYFGLGRYNLHHAWKLDHILDLAEQHGLYVHLVLENHGKLSTFVDAEWQHNPYNEDNGGFLSNCKNFFARYDAREQYKKKLRYIIARWGYSTRIMGFELWSEIDLTGNNWREHEDVEFLASKVAWHRHMTEHLKRIDHRRHLLTTHYSGTYRRTQAPLLQVPGIDYIALDAYRKKQCIVDLLRQTERSLSRFNKPVLVTEYGGSPMGTSLSRMEADLHAGLWSAYMMEHAGTPLLWWFMYIDRKNQYDHYRALAKFAAGEDRRGRGLKSVELRVAGPSGVTRWVEALALRNDRSAYVWVYDTRSAVEMPAPGDAIELADLSLQVDGLRRGAYRVEVWDTYRGRVVRTGSKIVERGRLTLQLPAFKNDLALKIKPSGGSAAESGP
jgi:hypothetical protein